MENERLIHAIGRIEGALNRIQNAKSRTEQPVVDEALVRRHTALKDEMKKAIQTIDGLIAQREQ